MAEKEKNILIKIKIKMGHSQRMESTFFIRFENKLNLCFKLCHH